MKALYRIETHRVAEPQAPKWGPVDSPTKAAQFITDRIGDLSREHYVAVYFGPDLTPIGYEIIGIGTTDGCHAHVRDIVGSALRLGCSRLVVGHNHPNGDLTPSPDDLRHTKALADGCTMFNITLLDAVIVNGDNHRSILQDAVRKTPADAVARLLGVS